MSNVTYLPWVPQDGEPTKARVVSFESVLGTSDDASTAEIVFSPDVETSVAPPNQSADEVYESLIRKLGVADMSSHEVRVWLREKVLDEAESEEILAKVEHLGYVDDYRLAEMLMNRLTLRKGQGRSAIALELRKRHLSPSAIDEAMAGIDQGAELDRALALATQRAPSLQRFDKATAERRLQGFLARRGYPSDIIREAIRAAFIEYPPVG
jgi:regulatory protein